MQYTEGNVVFAVRSPERAQRRPGEDQSCFRFDAAPPTLDESFTGLA